MRPGAVCDVQDFFHSNPCALAVAVILGELRGRLRSSSSGQPPPAPAGALSNPKAHHVGHVDHVPSRAHHAAQPKLGRRALLTRASAHDLCRLRPLALLLLRWTNGHAERAEVQRAQRARIATMLMAVTG